MYCAYATVSLCCASAVYTAGIQHACRVRDRNRGPALPHKWQSAESGREHYAIEAVYWRNCTGSSRFSCAELVQSRLW